MTTAPDLDELRALADQVITDLDTSALSDVLIILNNAYEPTIYSQTGLKPKWPYWASDTFQQMWESL